MKQDKPYITEIFSRINLHNLREFLLYGAELERDNAKGKTYEERLDEVSNPLNNRLTSLYANNEPERDIAISEYCCALNAHDDVYMEIGMKAGARLVYQLLFSDANPETEGK
jgi:hypothetical protein